MKFAFKLNLLLRFSRDQGKMRKLKACTFSAQCRHGLGQDWPWANLLRCGFQEDFPCFNFITYPYSPQGFLLRKLYVQGTSRIASKMSFTNEILIQEFSMCLVTPQAFLQPFCCRVLSFKEKQWKTGDGRGRGNCWTTVVYTWF